MASDDGVPPNGAPTCAVVLGAGRGGTTLLYKLLAMHRDIGYLSNYQARLPGCPATARLHRLIQDRHSAKLRYWFQEDGGAYRGGDNRRRFVESLVPAPVEADAVYRMCGVPLTPKLSEPPDAVACERLRQTFEAVRRHAGARILLTKRTANNRRIPWLECAFPDARYVLLLRDGRAVARSLMKVGWWSDHVLFWAGKTPREMVSQGADEHELAARNWVEAMGQIRRGLAGVAPDRVHVVKYEDLLGDPVSHIDGLLTFLGTPMSRDPKMVPTLAALGLRPHSGPWDRGLTDSQREVIARVQAEELSRWGYL